MSNKERVKIQLRLPMMYGWFEYGAGWHEVDKDLANYFLKRTPSSAVPYVDGSEAERGVITPLSRTVEDDPEDVARDIGRITEKIGEYEEKIRSSHRHPEHRPEYATQIAAFRSERTRLKELLEIQRGRVERVQESGPMELAERRGHPRRAGPIKPTNVPGEDRVDLYRLLYRWKAEDGASVIDKTTGRLNRSYPDVYETIFVEIINKRAVPPSCNWGTLKLTQLARAWDDGDTGRRKKMRDWIRRLVNDCSHFRDRIIQTSSDTSLASPSRRHMAKPPR